MTYKCMFFSWLGFFSKFASLDSAAYGHERRWQFPDRDLRWDRFPGPQAAVAVAERAMEGAVHGSQAGMCFKSPLTSRARVIEVASCLLAGILLDLSSWNIDMCKTVRHCSPFSLCCVWWRNIHRMQHLVKDYIDIWSLHRQRDLLFKSWLSTACFFLFFSPIKVTGFTSNLFKISIKS